MVTLRWLARLLRFFAAPSEVEPELFELAIKMRALESGLVGDSRHVAALALEVMFEVKPLEGLARVAQGLVEQGQRRRGSRRFAGVAQQDAVDVIDRYFVFERRQREVLDGRQQLRPLALPVVQALGVERAAGKLPGLHFLAFDQVREHQRGDFRDLVAVPGKLRQHYPHLAQTRHHGRVPARFGERR